LDGDGERLHGGARVRDRGEREFPCAGALDLLDNQIMVRGAYGSQPQRLWTALRASINELGHCYGLAPMGR